jgi:hypothetical protein
VPRYTISSIDSLKRRTGTYFHVEQENRLSASREPEYAAQIVFGFTDVLAGHGR